MIKVARTSIVVRVTMTLSVVLSMAKKRVMDETIARMNVCSKSTKGVGLLVN